MKAIGLLFVMIFSLGCFHLNAQINLKSKVKDQTTDRANNKVDEGIDKGLDAVENGVKNLFKKKKANPQEQTEKPAAQGDSNSQKPQADQTVQEEKTSLVAYSKFDFIPGEKIIFYDDYTSTKVGDFPPNWNTNASGEVVTTNLFPGNWFKLMGEGSMALEEGIKLPDNYTIEFDAITAPKEEGNTNYEFGFYLYSAKNPKDLGEGGAVPGEKGGVKMTFGYHSTYSAYDESGYTIDGTKDDAVLQPGKKYHLSFWVQKTRLRVYLDQVKIFDLPKVFKAGFQANMMRFEIWEYAIQMVSNFRIAAGLPDTRNKLLTEGKLVTYGIYFDVNKDVVKPESYATLKDIASILNEVPDVKVKIFGHTDSDGDDAKNMDLSKRRAASVKAELVKTFGVKASQLETDGLGETKPVAPNDTPVNKALNRRVEFIKL
ncbi:MAG: OmpA family protein [Mariniphaga sp.]